MRVFSYLPLLKELKAKRGCLNIENNDKKCFLWTVLASLHPVQPRNNPDRVSKCQEYEHDLNMSGIQCSVHIKDIPKFENQNNISVYGYENKKIFPYHRHDRAVHHVNLLYIIVGKTSHYVLQKDFSRLVLRQYNNASHKKCFCKYCLHSCISEEVLKKNHLGRCKLHGAQRIKLPEADDNKGHDKVKFTKSKYQLRLPFVIYANFKSILRKQDSCEPSSSKSFITQYQHHVPCGNCIYVKCSDGRYFELPQENIGDDAAKKFLNQVLAAATICR